MFFRQALASLFHLFAAFAFFAAGGALLCLFFSENLRFKAIELLFSHPSVCLQSGLALLGMGVLMTLGFYALHRGRYLRLKMGNHSAEINVALVRKVVEQHLEAHFPEKIFLLGVASVGAGRIEIEVQAEKREWIEQFEGRLNPLLRRQFGPINPYLTVRSTAKEFLGPGH